jgi:hypothetical protein
VRERVALKENWTAMSTGTIDQRMYAQVTRTRNRGLPQGFRNQPRSRVTVLNCGAVRRSATAVTGLPPLLRPAAPGGCSTCSTPSGG